MYVCMYVCMCMNIYIYIYVYIYNESATSLIYCLCTNTMRSTSKAKSSVRHQRGMQVVGLGSDNPPTRQCVRPRPRAVRTSFFNRPTLRVNGNGRAVMNARRLGLPREHTRGRPAWVRLCHTRQCEAAMQWVQSNGDGRASEQMVV